MPMTQQELDRELAALNSILDASSLDLKGASESRRVRAREQAAQRLAAERAANDRALLEAKIVADETIPGQFEGTSMMAQMLNLWNDPSIPADDPRKQQAYAYLTRETTTTTPEGVTTTPGLLGGDEEFTPRVKSGDEARADIAVEQIASAKPSGHTPGVVEELAVDFLPASIASHFTSDTYAQDLIEQRKFLANLLYLQSGAQAGEQEIEARRLQYFPQSGDSEETKRAKAASLAEFQRTAQAKHAERTGAAQNVGRPGDKYLE